MSEPLARLFNPKSIAVLGGHWGEAVISGLKAAGYAGEIWPVHPKRNEVCGIPCFAALENLPAAPDASFVAINRSATIEAISILSAMGGGGAVCFASGFREAERDDLDAAGLQERLVAAAGRMPILGPNCYGYLNYLDGVPIWPDQHGGLPVASGVAIIAQSSNIAINMTMQRRGLPIAAVVTVGNQAQTGVSDLAIHFFNDPRVSCVGLYLEGLGDIRRLEALAERARELGKPIVALKVGRSIRSRSAVMTHSASLSGSATVSSALLKRLGIIETQTPESFLETLKLLHQVGPLGGNRVVSISCSGGEAGLAGDLGDGTAIDFSEFSVSQKQRLRVLLGPIVTLSNPFDYHTFIWGDVPRMTETFVAACEGFDLGVMVLDLPRSDRCGREGYRCAVDAILATASQSRTPLAVLSLYPENLDETLAAEFHQGGVATLNGMTAGLAAIDAAIRAGCSASEIGNPKPVSLREVPATEAWLDEFEAKRHLSAAGVRVPYAIFVKPGERSDRSVLSELEFPVVLKGLGFLHKSEHRAVVLNIPNAEALMAGMGEMPAPGGYLIEEMIGDSLAELLVGVRTDETGLVSLTLGAGGVLTELLADTVTIVLPADKMEIATALRQTRVGRVLDGYRGGKRANEVDLVDTIARTCDLISANDWWSQIEVNPLIVREQDCVAVDAAIAVAEEE